MVFKIRRNRSTSSLYLEWEQFKKSNYSNFCACSNNVCKRGDITDLGLKWECEPGSLPVISTTISEIIENPQKFDGTNVRVSGEIDISALLYSGVKGQAGGAIIEVKLRDDKSYMGLRISDITGKYSEKSQEFKAKYNSKKVVIEGRVEWSGKDYLPSIVVKNIELREARPEPQETLIDLAQEVLIRYFSLLSEGKYTEAVKYHGSGYDDIAYSCPKIDLSDYAGLLECGCHFLVCEKINIVKKEQVSINEFVFTIQFVYEDGSLVKSYPYCCGQEPPEGVANIPKTEFEYRVKKIGADFFVITRLFYVPKHI